MKVDNEVMMNEKPMSKFTELEFRIVDELGEEKIGEVLLKKVNINGLDAGSDKILTGIMEVPILIKIDRNFFNAKLFEKEYEDGMIGAPIYAAMTAPLPSVFNVGLPPNNFKIGDKWNLIRRDTNYIKGEMLVVTENYNFIVSDFKDTLGHTCAIFNLSANSDVIPLTPELLAAAGKMEMVSKYNSATKGRVLVDKHTGLLVSLKIQKEYTLNAIMNGEEMDMTSKEELDVAVIESNIPGYKKNVKNRLLSYYRFNDTKKTGSSLTEKIKQNPRIDLLADIEWDDIDPNDEGSLFWLKGLKSSGAINIIGDTLVPFKNYILSSWNDPDFFENGYGVIKTASSGYEILKRDGTKIPIDKRYHSVRAFDEGRAVVEIDDKFGDLYGLIDSTGKEVAAPFFSSIEEFNGGYAKVTKDYKHGVIDINGKVVIPFNSNNTIYSLYSRSPFSINRNRSPYGISIFNKDTKKYHILTPYTNGEIKGPFISVNPFENGFAKATVDGGWNGIIDSTCSFSVPPIYGFMLNKKNGEYLVGKSKGLYGIINTLNKTIIPLECNNIEDVKDTNIYIVEKEGKKGAMSNVGQVILPLEYDNVHYLKGGMLKVENQGFSGVFNLRGETVLPFEFEEVMCFDSITNLFSVTKQGKAFLIESSGKVLRELLEDERYFFCNMQDGVTVWRNAEGKYGLRHLINGSNVLSYEYDDIRSFSPFGFILHKSDEIGLVNNKGNFLLPLNKMEIDEFRRSKIITTYKINGRYGIISMHGEVLLEPDFDAIEIVRDDLLYVKSNEKLGIIKIKN